MNIEEFICALADALPLAGGQTEPITETAREPVTHDYTRRYWGHDFTYTANENGRELTLMIWGPKFNVGDYLILPNKDRTTRYRITFVEWLHDPSDMYRLEAKFAPRSSEDR